MDPEESYRRFARFYDSYVRGFKDDLSLYALHTGPGDFVLEVGCGTGRILEYLLNLGCRVTGVDTSKEMLEIARSKLRHYIDENVLKLINHDIGKTPLPGNYNRVFITWYTMNYIVNPTDFLINLKESLAPATLLIFDLFFPVPLLYPRLNGAWVDREIFHEGKKVMMRDRRVFRNGIERRTQVYRWEGEEITIDTDRRFYSKNDMNTLLTRCGYTDVCFIENYRGEFTPLESEPETRSGFMCRAGYRRMLPGGIKE